MLRRILENALRALKGPVGILYHIVVVCLSAGIALSLPVTVSFLARQFLVYWSLIENERVFLISVEIAVAVVLILFFHSIGRSWQDKRLARMARGAGMVYFTPSRGGLARRRIRRLKERQGLARDVMIIGSTGFRTFVDPKGDLHAVIQQCREARIMLLNPESDGAAARRRFRMAAKFFSAIFPTATPEFPQFLSPAPWRTLGSHLDLVVREAPPLKRADAAFGPERVPGRERTVRMLRVLIAEEKALAAVRLQAQLEGLGHRVVGVAPDGKEAVEVALMLEPDLVIMNIRLPVMDGINAAQTILRRRAIPIILLTAYFSAGLGPRAREAGVMAHLVKPVDGGQLRSTIKMALTRFEELQALRREGITLRKALETRTLVERAKRVLMEELKLSEVEAFGRMQHHSQSTNKSFHAIASTIVKADELLVRRLDFAKCLQGIHRVIRPGLREVASMTKAATTK